MSLIMLLLFVAGAFLVAIWTKKVFWLTVYLFGTVSAAGLMLEVWQFIFGLPSLFFSHVVVGSISILMSVWILAKKKNRNQDFNKGDLVVYASALLVAVFLILNRLFIDSRIYSPLAGLSRLTGGEDNGKWLDFSSSVVKAEPIQLQGGVSAGLAVLLILSVALAEVLSNVILGGENQLAITVQSVILAHGLLIALAPLAISPFIDLRQQLIIRSNYAIKTEESNKSSNLFGLFFGGIFLVFGVSAAVNYGHLSLEYLLLGLVFSVSAVIVFRGTLETLVIAVLIFSVAGLVWMPFTYLSIIVSGLVLFWSIKTYFANPQRQLKNILVFSALFLAIVVAAFGDLVYLFYQSSDSGIPVKSLIIAEGGTMEIDWALAIILSVCTSAYIYYFSQRDYKKEKSDILFAVLPVIILLGYFLAVAAYDAWSTTGGQHYGTRKIGYAVTIVLISALVVFFMEIVAAKAINSVLLQLGVIGISLYLLVSSALIPRAFAAVGPGLWPHSDVTKTTEWAQYIEVQDSPVQDLADLPIGCLIETNGRYQPGVGPGYMCTRQLISVKSLEDEAHFLNDFLLHGSVQISKDFMSSLEGMNSNVMNSKMLIIDDEGKILRIVVVADLVNEIRALQKNLL